MNYKTPGVYVEEQAKFPPSVAQVETAIPAFVGYTAKGPRKPARIASMLEYENLFGKANPENFAVDFKDGVANATQTNVGDYKMYYAMQMYFANGGGPCYIVSVGNYTDLVLIESTDNDKKEKTLSYGLELLKKEDEPTLIVFPDLQSLITNTGDVAAATASETVALSNKEIAEGARTAALAVVAAAAGASAGIAGDAAVASANSYNFTGTGTPLQIASQQAARAVAAAAKTASLVTNATAVTVKTAAQAAAVVYNQYVDTATKSAGAATLAKTAAGARSAVDAVAVAYSIYNNALNQAESMKDRFVIMDVLGDEGVFRDKVNAPGLKYGAAYYPKLKTVLSFEFDEAEVLVTGAFGMTNLAALKSNSSDLYNLAKNAIAAKQVVMAPSSAMAGVYAKVDRTSGVFKAPANVGLNYVVAPTEKISQDKQDGLNVDVTAGKSINAIRTFTGKGTLVWGARTLDGNSNEWRYVSVRRFFNMVEESVKKSTERFVFEPNTANTWVRIQTMIENFLNQQWRDGALAGSKPEEAYYVSVGLNKTMTAQDILEGRMVIEVGMAAVRPAEFIVLRFSHKLQEA